jgi:Xaa-Pro aminopeptidase
VDWSRSRKANLESARYLTKEAGLDALLVTSMDNVRYITGERLYFAFDDFPYEMMFLFKNVHWNLVRSLGFLRAIHTHQFCPVR